MPKESFRPVYVTVSFRFDFADGHEDVKPLRLIMGGYVFLQTQTKMSF